MDDVTMTYSYIERYEKDIQHSIEIGNLNDEIELQKLIIERQKFEIEKLNEKIKRQNVESVLKEIIDGADDEGNVMLSESTLQKALSITDKI